jgi:uncharacterized protein (TIGR02646 family)
MIKIQNEELEKLSKKHYFSIKEYIENHSKYSISELNENIKNCFNENWDLEKLILAKPKELEELTLIYKKVDFKFFGTLYDYFNQKDKFKFYDKDYTAYELIKSLNINICPYCNRNGIHNLKKSKKRTSELDHFHPQSKYPFLAISFYNLIPSCKVCNKIKLDKDNKKYINPYDDRFDFNKNMKFTLKIKDSSFIFSEDGFELKYKFAKDVSSDEKRRIVNNRKDFELKDLYSNHKDIVLELIQKREIYPDSYIDDLFHQYEGTLFKNREDVLRHITGGYIEDKDINKRPLSKLIKDISEELDLI